MSDMALPTRLRPRTELGPWPLSEFPAVYAMVPPMLTAAGFSEFVIVATNFGARRVVMFACDDDGRIEDWEPLAEFPGVDAKAALRACGYEEVPFDGAA